MPACVRPRKEPASHATPIRIKISKEMSVPAWVPTRSGVTSRREAGPTAQDHVLNLISWAHKFIFFQKPF